MPVALFLGWLAVAAMAVHRWRPPPGRLAAFAAPPPAAVHRVAARHRWALGAVPAAIGAALVWPPLGVGIVALAVGAPRWRAHRAAARQRTLVVQGLPEVADLLVLAVGAGLNPLLALRRITPLAPPPYAGALFEVLHRVDRGVRLGDALEHLERALGPPAAPVVAALAATERYGTPLGPALDALAHDARRQRRHLAEEAARRLPVRLSFPLVCCILPAFVLLTVAPLVAGALTSLHLSAP